MSGSPPDDGRGAILTVAGFAVLMLVAVFLLGRAFKGFHFGGADDSNPTDERPTMALPSGSGGLEPAEGDESGSGIDAAELARQSQLARMLLEAVLAARADPNAISDELVLRFSSDEAFRRFLEAARKAGIDVRGIIDQLRAVRVGTDALQELRDALEPFANDVQNMESNYYVSIPDLPIEADPRNPTLPSAPFGGGTLSWLGISGDASGFGRGVTIAVLDSGIAQHAAFDGARITSFDLVSESAPRRFVDEVGHGTAVSSIIVGQSPDAPGIAPAARLLNYRVTGADGLADSFTLTRGILSAVDEGAQLINISLGSYSSSPILSDAMIYAAANNVLVVASSGNDALADAAYPARYESAVAVGANDTNGLQLYYSNSSPTLDIMAPGDRLAAVDPGGGFVSFSGTSAAAPVVTASLAAIMSEFNLVDPAAALAILQGNSNEGGGPGIDPDYGSGVANLGRALNSKTKGISDAAAVYPYLDTANDFGYGADSVLFMVENRGTEPLANVPLIVTTSSGQRFQKVFPRLMPDEVGVLAIDAAAGSPPPGNALTYGIQVLYPGQTDAVPENNLLNATLLQGDAGAGSAGPAEIDSGGLR